VTAQGQTETMSSEDRLTESTSPRGGAAPTGDMPAAGTSAGTPQTAPTGRRRGRGGGNANMLPERERRRFGIERLLVRLVATTGIVGVGVVLGAILTSQKVQGWIIGLVIAVVTVVLSAILWSSRQL
jgi:hypothetical protein